MKVNEITDVELVEYLKEQYEDLSPIEISNLNTLLVTAKAFISSYTGIPIASADTSVKTLDDYEDFYIVVLVLCQDMHDNRTLYVDKSNLNKVVETILGMHSTNLL